MELINVIRLGILSNTLEQESFGQACKLYSLSKYELIGILTELEKNLNLKLFIGDIEYLSLTQSAKDIMDDFNKMNDELNKQIHNYL
ncbi:hypothetical protein CF386_09950 [Paraphotobacterium marinum]|uniref:HTH lysR-type domain-containing protein n=1 Tax=Paraphotobacterium marinum TaxID=1755811 RepID=A0A220VG84_9GAMM|nr:hypothetical protein [Paraphotobacterium marinum]ASK79375.1 hypothetical protein CF386_09950 [Paraphotobacterium marinum]